MRVVAYRVCLVEDAQHLVEAVVNFPVQARNLHDDAVVRQALHKGVVDTLLHQIVIVVVHLVVHIDHGCVNVPHGVAKQVDCHHGQGMGPAAQFEGIGNPRFRVGHHVLLVAILGAEVLAEA